MLVVVSVGLKFMLVVDILFGFLFYLWIFLLVELFVIIVYDNEFVRFFSSKWFKYDIFVWNSYCIICINCILFILIISC